MTYATARARQSNGELNKLYPEDRAVHEWYRFVLSFPPHLVRQYLQDFGIDERHRVLDPFCGTGTTVVECKKLGIRSVGLEANPMAAFASHVKTDWRPAPDGLMEHAASVVDATLKRLSRDGISKSGTQRLRIAEERQHALQSLPPEQGELLLTNSISPLPLHKSLVLLDCLREHAQPQYYAHERLALARALVQSISNLHFGPEVGVGPAKPNAPVVGPWEDRVQAMADDLRRFRGKDQGMPRSTRRMRGGSATYLSRPRWMR